MIMSNFKNFSLLKVGVSSHERVRSSTVVNLVNLIVMPEIG